MTLSRWHEPGFLVIISARRTVLHAAHTSRDRGDVGARDATGGGRVATLGMFVRDRRQAAGQTQRQLAEAAGVSVGTIRDLEQGISGRPRRATMQGLATALRVSVE